jgi:hypothetical protein
MAITFDKACHRHAEVWGTNRQRLSLGISPKPSSRSRPA